MSALVDAARAAVDGAQDTAGLGSAWLLICGLFEPSAEVQTVALIPLVAAWVRRADAIGVGSEERAALHESGRGPDWRTARACLESTRLPGEPPTLGEYALHTAQGRPPLARAAKRIAGTWHP